VIYTKNFNLLVSTSRFNEENAEAELWFTLLMCGDEYSIISKTSFSGLISALTSIDTRNIISQIHKILEKNPQYFQFILKVVPIDFICETNTKTIAKLIHEHHKSYIQDTDSFRIILKRRKHEKIERNVIIEQIAKKIDNKVDLENPDKVIRVEVLGNFSGVSFLESNDIIRTKND